MKDAPTPIDNLMGWMQGLSDPTRLRLLRLLETQELGVVELCDILQLPQSTVSRHLKVLTDLGLTRSRRQGTNHLYRLTVIESDPTARQLWELSRKQTEGWPAVRQDELRLANVLSQRSSARQTFFSTSAGEWDKIRAELYGTSFSTRAMLSLIDPNLIVADLGCGTGMIAADLAPVVKQVIGIDSNDTMLHTARLRTREFDNVTLTQSDLETLPLQDESCDAALMILVLTYADNPQKVLAEMRRILKPNGKAIIVDLLSHDREDFRVQYGQSRRGFDSADFESLLKETGFATVTTSPLPAQSAVKGPALFLSVAQTK